MAITNKAKHLLLSRDQELRCYNTSLVASLPTNLLRSYLFIYLLLILCRPPLGSIKHRYMQENKMYNILDYIAGLIQK